MRTKQITERELTPQEYTRHEQIAAKGRLQISNGDKATGAAHFEDGRMWFIVTDSNGQEYETDEQPYELLFTMVRFEGDWNGEQVTQWFKDNPQ
jgi:hypothetical protein